MRKAMRRLIFLLCITLVCTPFYSLCLGGTAQAAASEAETFLVKEDAFVSNFNTQGNSVGVTLNANKLIYGKSRHAYLKFDLSSIDTDRYTIDEMNMTLNFRKSHAANELVFNESVSKLSNSDTEWTVTNLTYSNRPNDIVDSPIVKYNVASTGEENLSVDLTPIFQFALSNGRKVITIHLTTAGVNDSAINASEMYSSRNTAGQPGPSLSVKLGNPVFNDGIDRTALIALIAAANQLVKADYTTNTWDMLTTALQQAIAISGTNTTQTEADQAALSLQAAMDNLEAAELPTKIAAPSMGNYYNDSKTAAMIFKMKNKEGKYIKVDPVTEKLSLSENTADASTFALYVLDYFANLDHTEPEVGATRTAYSIKSLDNNKYLTIQNYYTAEEFLSNTHQYYNILNGAPSGTSVDRTFEVKASATMPNWNERYYVDHYAQADVYRIWSHLSTMRDDMNFSRFNVMMTEDTMQSSGTVGANLEYPFYFEQVTGNDLLEISQDVSGNDVELFWLPVNGDTNPDHYSIDGQQDEITYTDGKMRFSRSGISSGIHNYVVEYNGNGYQARSEVKVRIFNHPGILLTTEDLSRMKQHVQAKEEPWYSDYLRLLDSVPYGVAGLDYEATVFTNVGRGGAPSDSANMGYFEKGGNAAYYNALQWVITDDDAFADKAVSILNKWAKGLKVIDGRDRILGAGINAYKYASAAEIIKYYNGGYHGYHDADFKALQAMMINVVYPVIQDAGVPMIANGNWDAAAMVSMMAIGVLCDNTDIFDRAMAMYQDIHINGSIFAYVNDSGQSMETGRDQAHAMLGIGYMAEISLIAYNQNADLYSLYDNRLAKAFEYTAKYNLYSKELYGEDVPFTAMPNVFGDTSRGYYGTRFDNDSNGLNRGELRPVFEQALALYTKAGGVDMTWTARAAAASRPQAMVHFDNLNFGTLTHYNGEALQSNESDPYFQMRTRWEPLYQRNWSTVGDQKVAETLNSYFDIQLNGELTTSVMKKDAPFFQLITNKDGTYSIRAVKTNTYLSIKEDKVGDFNVIKADAAKIGDSEKFILQSSGVGPYFLVSPMYDHRVIYQQANGSGSNAVLTLVLGTKKLSDIKDVPDVTTSERLIFMYNLQENEAPVTPTPTPTPIPTPTPTPTPSSEPTSTPMASPEPAPSQTVGTTSPAIIPDAVVLLNGARIKVTPNIGGGFKYTGTRNEIAAALGNKSTLLIEAGSIKDITVELPITAMGAAGLTVQTEFGTLSIPNHTLLNIKKKVGDTLALHIQYGSYKLELLKEGKPISYEDADSPFIVTLPVKVAEGYAANEYVVIKKENDNNIILPMAISDASSVTFTIRATGTYDVLYNGKSFQDVTDSFWAAKDIAFVTARELFTGIGDNRFSPKMTMTRAMFAQALANFEGIKNDSFTETVFTDVPNGRWYSSAINWAASNGIIQGTSKESFSPDDNITREQMAAMLYNYASYKGYKLPDRTFEGFSDNAKVGTWANQAVGAIATAGIIQGKPDGRFAPKDHATRAEVATVFARFIRTITVDEQ